MSLTVSAIEAKQIKLVYKTIKAGAFRSEGTFLQEDGSLFEIQISPAFEDDKLSVWIENCTYDNDGNRLLKRFEKAKMTAKDIAKL